MGMLKPSDPATKDGPKKSLFRIEADDLINFRQLNVGSDDLGEVRTTVILCAGLLYFLVL